MGESGTTTTGDESSDDDAHLADVPDGCGCAEIWEQLAEQRGEGTSTAEEST